MTNYNITITSDVVCPFCYIGHTRLSRAIAEHQKIYPADKFSLHYTPFYLNPAEQVKDPNASPFPIPSVPRREHIINKFGAERAQQIESTIHGLFSDEGIPLDFGGRIGPSRNGHRLVYWAQSVGGEHAQNNVMQALWKRFFEQAVDITELEVLTEVGVEAGLGSTDEVRTYLSSGKDAATVDDMAEEARQKGISSVPHYEIQGQWHVGGSQQPSTFKELFIRWKEMEEEGNAGKEVLKEADREESL